VQRKGETWRGFLAFGIETITKGGFANLFSQSRSKLSKHREARRAYDHLISHQSRRGLDLTNFFLADVQVGFGSFLAFYLAEKGWSKQDVGLALTIGSLSALVSQIPGGALADALKWKRGLAMTGIIAIAVAAIMLAVWPTFPMVFAAEVLHGLTAGITGTAITAISLGLVGRHAISARIGRNFRYAAAGNAVTAVIMGLFGAYLQSSAIFFSAALLCIPALGGLMLIRPNEIDYVRARNATRQDHSFSLRRVVDLSKNRQLLLFALCLILFHLSNASLLPLLGQNLGASKTQDSTLMMSALIAGPQIVVAFWRLGLAIGPSCGDENHCCSSDLPARRRVQSYLQLSAILPCCWPANCWTA